MKFQVGEEVIRTVKPEDTGRREIIGFSGIIIENFAHYALIKNSSGRILDIIHDRLRHLTKLDKALK